MYFKPSLPENQPAIVTIVQRYQPKQDPQYGPKFPYTINWNGTEYQHEATMTEEKTLQKFQIGQEAQITKKPNAHGTLSMYWNEVPRGAPTTQGYPAPAYSPNNPPSGASGNPYLQPAYTPSNPPPVAPPAKPEVDWDKIADSKILFGFMVAFIEQGKDENQAYAKGMAAFRLHKKGESEIATGIPSTPPAHSPAQLAEVNALFAPDTVAVLPALSDLPF